MGMLDSDVMLSGLTNIILNFDFIAGSSKHGNAFLASVGWNCVIARELKEYIIIHMEEIYHVSSNSNTTIGNNRIHMSDLFK